MLRVVGDHLVSWCCILHTVAPDIQYNNLIIMIPKHTPHSLNALPYVGHNLCINPTVASI